MGAEGGRVRSEAKTKAAHENAKQPRPNARKQTPEQQAYYDECTEILRAALPTGVERMAAVLEDPTTPWGQFIVAMEFAADRGGLPRLTEQRVMGENVAPIRIRLEGLKPPWLEAQATDSAEGEGAPGDGSGNGEPGRANGSG